MRGVWTKLFCKLFGVGGKGVPNDRSLRDLSIGMLKSSRGGLCEKFYATILFCEGQQKMSKTKK